MSKPETETWVDRTVREISSALALARRNPSMATAVAGVGLLSLLVYMKPWEWSLWQSAAKPPAKQAAAKGAVAGRFRFTTFDVARHGRTHPSAINASGEIVGEYGGPDGQWGFLRKVDGSIIRLQVPDAFPDGTHPTGINTEGDIVGFYYARQAQDQAGHGFIRRAADGTFAPFDFPGAEETLGYGINDRGEIVGAYKDREKLTHGFLRRPDGTFEDLRYPFATSTIPMGINNRRQIAGYWQSATAENGFLLDGGTFTLIQIDPQTSTMPRAINDSGTVVGESASGAFVYAANDQVSRIEHPRCDGSCKATGINIKGEIVGQYQVGSEVHGFIAVVSE